MDRRQPAVIAPYEESMSAAKALAEQYPDNPHVQTLLNNLPGITHYDPNLGIPNRAWLHANLDIMLRQAERQNQPLVVGLYDTDEFKDVNDKHGHPIGDRVLAAIAHVFNEGVRKSDTFGRYGGDEWYSIHLNSDLTTMHMRVGQIIQPMPYRLNAMGLPRVTVSSGLAMYIPQRLKRELGRFTEDATVTDAAGLVKLADDRLLTAKHEGKDFIYWGQPLERRVEQRDAPAYAVGE